MKEHIVYIHKILPGSIAEEVGIQPGDGIISINGEKIRDVFDYRFVTADEFLLVEVLKSNDEVWEVEIEKDEGEDLGLEFSNPLIEEEKSCTNQCIFCFIDQLPRGMRSTVYFKDDDSRLSFLTGNYVTLTNMKEDDIDRIIRYRMSPINVSVHTTHPDLRVKMLKNKFAGNIMERIKRLVEGGIQINCQIVLCRGVNDGEELQRTLSDLSPLYPGMGSISIVPVGITKYREGLHALLPYDKIASIAVVQQVEKTQQEFLNKHHARVVYLADEFYLMAGMAVPSYDAYEDFPQLENGVGLIALLKHEFHKELKQRGNRIKLKAPRTVSIATGTSAYETLCEMTAVLVQRFRGLQVHVFAIENNFFGEHVTVAGLLTGKDLIDQLQGKALGEVVLISSSMLKAGEAIFLDDYTMQELEEVLKVKIIPVSNHGSDFINKILGI